MRVTRWPWPLRHYDPDREAYRKVGEVLGSPEPAVRRAFHEMLMKVRGVSDRRHQKVSDSYLRVPVVDVHPDFQQVGDLLAGVLSRSDALLLDTRLRNDVHAFERMWPLVEAWEANWRIRPAERIYGLIAGRLSKPEKVSAERRPRRPAARDMERSR